MNTTTNTDWNEVDAATDAAIVNATQAIRVLNAAGWEVVSSAFERDDLGVRTRAMVEMLSPEGAAIQITIEEPEWATEARLG